MPAEADVVVIGAGIVGSCLAAHLGRLGVGRVVLIDKGPLPNPGGSTGHASNFIFPIDHSKMMTLLTLDSVAQYEQLGVLTRAGGIEVARRPERLEELARRIEAGMVYGEPAELLDPKGVKGLVPFIDESVILGGMHCPGVAVVDSLRAGTLLRDEAVAAGRLHISARTEVTGIEVVGGTVRGVQTNRGDVAAGAVVVCCGVWSPRMAAMAGATIPLTPAVHQMIDVGPVPRFAGSQGEIEFPVVRDVDVNMYERQHGSELEIGSYAHRPILLDPSDIPSNEAAALSPTEMPFTADDFDPQMEHALELMPEVLADESVGVKYAINGLLSLTPDGYPLLGEVPGVRGLWSAAAIWIKEAPGMARAVAERMVLGRSELDITGGDIARFHPHQRTRAYVAARAAESFNKMYAVVHPAEQAESARQLRLSPFAARQAALGAHLVEAGGWERPHWYESNAPLLERYAGTVSRRPAEWDARWWSPIIDAEHLAMRERAGLVDLSAFCHFDITGPGALGHLQGLCVAQVDVAPGRVVYTSLLDERARMRADLTVIRLGDRHFRVVTGASTGMLDRAWFEAHLPEDGSAQLHDATSALSTIGLWGPEARRILERLTEADVSQEGFAFGTCRQVDLGPVPVLCSRISYVGELGWEIHVPVDAALGVWDRLSEAGEPSGLVPVGIGVYATTGRMEKSYRAYGTELTMDFDLVEAGMTRPRVKAADFIGRDAYLAQRDAEPAARLCTLTLDDPADPDDTRAMLGSEPVVERSGAPLVDRLGRRSYVTSAGFGPSVGKHLLMAYLPPGRAVTGTPLAVEYCGERHPATVAAVGAVPLFDPDNERVRS